MQPEPPLLPADPARRRPCWRPSAWGDEVLQPVPRRLAWAALRRDRSTLETYLEDARLGIPPAIAARTAAAVIRLAARLNRATDEAVRARPERLPGAARPGGRLIAEGVIGGASRNAADFQIATSVRLLMTFEDLRPADRGAAPPGARARGGAALPGPHAGACSRRTGCLAAAA